ncbi:hypothetical protein Tco_0594212 [Tanacetum coccineum]
MSSRAQQIKLDNALVAPENHRVIGKCNIRINPRMKPKEPTYQVVLDALALITCYPAFLITAEVPIDNKRFSVNVEVFRDILNICPRIAGQEFDEPPTEEEALSFIRELGHSREIKYITDVIVDHLHQPWRTFASIINKCLCGKDLAYQIDNIDSKKQEKMDDSVLGDEPPKSRKSQKNSDSAISSEESPSKKKSAKAKKVAATKPKPNKKKPSVKADKGKGLNVLSEVALSEATQLKEATKRSKKEFHASHASGLDDGTDLGLGVPDEQHHKTSGTDEGTGTKPVVPDVPKYDSESEKESWGDSGEDDDDDEDDSVDESDDGDDNNDDDYNDGNDGDDRIKIHVLNQSSTEYYKEEEEKIDDEEKMDEEEDDEVTKELYNDVNVNLGNRDTEMTDGDQGGADQQNVS